MDSASVMIAVRVVDEKAACRVVDNAVVAVVRPWSNMKHVARQHAAMPDAAEDAIAKEDLVDVHGEVGDAIDIAGGIEVAVEDELVLA